MTDCQNLTEHDAIEAAVAEYGKDRAASVANTARLKHPTAETVRSTAFASAFS